MGLLCCSLFLCCLSATDQWHLVTSPQGDWGQGLLKKESQGVRLNTSLGNECFTIQFQQTTTAVSSSTSYCAALTASALAHGFTQLNTIFGMQEHMEGAHKCIILIFHFCLEFLSSSHLN